MGMIPEINGETEGADRKEWKRIFVEFGSGALEIQVPSNCIELTMKDVNIVPDPRAAIERALSAPIGSPKLDEIVRAKGKPPRSISVAIAVSDITRPMPYKGEEGLLFPLLNTLQSLGIPLSNIRIIVATGMHRPSTPREKTEMYGQEVVDQFPILDHDCEDPTLLVDIGRTQRGTDVYVNRHFFHSDLKIITGLVESHFMAGISGGRKSICPGLVDVKTIQRFHGPHYLEDPRAINLSLDGNPCHEEALEVAKTVGVDFMVNVNIDKDLRLNQVFAGDLVEAHHKAYAMIKGYAEIPLERPFDIVLTHGGFVGRDHYQTAKAGVGAIPAVKQQGTIIIAANNRDPTESIGSLEYRSLIHLMKMQGPDGYLELLNSPHWRFTKDQWEPEVWGKVIRWVGEEGLIYCSPEIPRHVFSILPGQAGYEFLREEEGGSPLELARRMVQGAVLYAIHRERGRGFEPTMAFIREGPYAVPVLTRGNR